MAEFTLEQQKAIDTLDKNVVVSAGAGAGKTRVLVERYLKIIKEERACCSEVLAITFTKKAAKEMKDRIRSEVVRLLGESNVEQKAWWRTVKQDLEYAPISTIHSLCSRLLRENPVEAGVDPSFQLIEEIEYVLLKEKAINKVLTQAFASRENWFENLVQNYGINFLQGELVRVYDALAAENKINSELVTVLSDPYQKRLAELDQVKNALSEACRGLFDMPVKKKAKKETQEKVAKLVEAVKQNWEKITQAIEAYPKEETGNAEEILDRYLGGFTKTISRDLVDNLAIYKQIKYDRLALQFIPDICLYLAALHREIVQLKNEKQALTYNDLELNAYKLLSANPEVCKKYLKKFSFIMVDEFQDTNNLQRKLVYLLSGGDSEAITGKNLFIVGDPKQSIYRFRGADVSVFGRVSKDIEASQGVKIDLNTNFRSAGDLLSMFNTCFSRIIGKHEKSSVFFNELTAFHKKFNKTAVELLLIDGKDESQALLKRDAEAEMLASRIKHMVESDEVLPDASKPVYGDMAILLRAFTDLETYEAALQRHNIPYYVVEGKGFYGRQEIVDILNMLKVIDNVNNDQALMGALRSPMFTLSDETIIRLKSLGESIWAGLCQADKLSLSEVEIAVCQKAKTIIERLLFTKGLLPVVEIMKELLVATEYPQILLTQFMGIRKHANVQKFVDFATNFSTREYHTLNDFIKYVEILIDQAKEGEAEVDSEKGETVKIMTIHKAKGLEFPIVFVPDLHRQISKNSASAMYVTGLGLGLKIPSVKGNINTYVYDTVSNENHFLAIEEFKRLLYVAMTRAENYLVLSGVYKKPGSPDKKQLEELNCWLNWVLYTGDTLTDYDLISDLLPLGSGVQVLREVESFSIQEKVISDEGSDASQFQDDIVKRLQMQIQPLPDSRLITFSPTQLNLFSRCPKAYFYKYIVEVPEFYDSERLSLKPPAYLVGIAAHKCCELYKEGIELETCIQEACENQVSQVWKNEIAFELRPMLNRFFTSDFYREIKQFKTKQEWRYRHKFREHIFTGSIDRLIYYPDGSLGILDYKTDQVEKEDVLEKSRMYTWQLVLYAFAAEMVLRQPVKDATLYFLKPEICVPIELTEANRKKVQTEVLALCDYIVEYRQEVDYQPVNKEYCPYCSYKNICPDCSL